MGWIMQGVLRMPRHLITAALVPMLFAVDWLTFHDLFEPHTFRDYLTLAASMLIFIKIGLDIFRDRENAVREIR
jgi:hypothetical protein